MSEILYGFKLFGREMSWDVSTAVLILMLIEIVLIVFCLIIFGILMARKLFSNKKKQTILVTQSPAVRKVRALQGITLDTVVVQRDFKVGEDFNCEGLIVIANYSEEPVTEVITDYTVFAPDMNEEGKPNVTVSYRDFSAVYPISITRDEVVEEEEVEVPVRTLTGITLQTALVKNEFKVGEEFNCEGLTVTANYDVAPFEEQVYDYEVTAPDMTVEGTATVYVSYRDKSAFYMISIVPAVPDEVAATEHNTIIIDEESAEAGILRYDRSFTARLIQSDDDTKQWYTILKNELLSYKKVKDRMSWKRETYRIGREVVAKFGYRGKVLCLFLAVNPADYVDTKYKLEDVSDNKSFEETPSMYRLKNSRRVKFAIELIQTIMERMGAKRIERISQDYYMPYEGVVELINKGLIKRNIKSSADEAIFFTHGANDNTIAPEGVQEENSSDNQANE